MQAPPPGCDVELAPTVGNPVPPALRGPGPWQLCGAFGTGGAELIQTSRDGRRSLVLTDSGQVWVLDTRTFDLVGVFVHGAAGISFAGLSPDGGTLATVDDQDGIVALWDVDSHRLLHVITRGPGQPSYYGLGEASFSRDGRLLAVISNTHLDVYDVRTGDPLPISARTDLGGGMRVGFAADDTRLVIAQFNYFGNIPFAGFGKIALVDSTTGNNLVPVPLPTSALVTFAISGDTHKVAVGNNDPTGGFTILLIDPVTGTTLHDTTIQGVPLTLNHDASLIAVADPPPPPAPATVSVRRTSDGSLIESVTLPAGPRGRIFAVTSDLEQLLAGNVPPQVVVRVSLDSGKTRRVACGTGHFTEITALGVTRDGRKLVSTGTTVSGDTTLVWNAHTGALLDIPIPVNLKTPSATSPDGKLLAELDGTGPNFNLIEIATNTVVATLGPAPTRPVSFDFSPNGALIASDSQRDPGDRRLNPVASLWSVGGASLIQPLPLITSVPIGDAEPVLFAPGGRHLFVGGYSTTALWCH